jgi:hypothetical protein
MFNEVWHEGLHENVGATVFLHWSSDHGVMLIMKNKLPLSEPRM